MPIKCVIPQTFSLTLIVAKFLASETLCATSALKVLICSRLYARIVLTQSLIATSSPSERNGQFKLAKSSCLFRAYANRPAHRHLSCCVASTVGANACFQWRAKPCACASFLRRRISDAIRRMRYQRLRRPTLGWKS